MSETPQLHVPVDASIASLVLLPHRHGSELHGHVVLRTEALALILCFPIADRERVAGELASAGIRLAQEWYDAIAPELGGEPT